jgi:hypothetical protein
MTRAATLAALFLALGLTAARAEDGPPPLDPAQAQAFDARTFRQPIGDKTAYACFVRRYDADHLAHHPHQKVLAMKLLVTGAQPKADETHNYGFRLGVRLRQRSGEFSSAGSCSHSTLEGSGNELGLGCGVECDGGGIEVAVSSEGKTATVRLERLRIWRPRDEEGDDSLEAGADDKAFRLERANLTECAPLASDRKEIAALKRQQKANGG